MALPAELEIPPYGSRDQLDMLAEFSHDMEMFVDPDIQAEGLRDLLRPTGHRVVSMFNDNRAEAIRLLGEVDEVFRIPDMGSTFTKLMLLGIHDDPYDPETEVYNGFYDADTEGDIESHRTTAAVHSGMIGVSGLFRATGNASKLGGFSERRALDYIFRNFSVETEAQLDSLRYLGTYLFNKPIENINNTFSLTDLKKLQRGIPLITRVLATEAPERIGVINLADAFANVVRGVHDLEKGNVPKELLLPSDEPEQTPAPRGIIRIVVPDAPQDEVVYEPRDTTPITDVLSGIPFSGVARKVLKGNTLGKVLQNGGRFPVTPGVVYEFSGLGDNASDGLGLVTKMIETFRESGEDGLNEMLLQLQSWVEQAAQVADGFRTVGCDELLELQRKLRLIDALFSRSAIQVIRNTVGVVDNETRVVLNKIAEVSSK